MKLSFSYEPAAWLAVIRAGIYLGSLFGLNLTPEQTGALVVFVELALGLVQRQSVTPNVKLSAATVEAAKDVPPNPPV